ncbi:hypothetical protein Pla8534_26780 [Lignipirellula cremea]|uniref:Uncharacterized protein n=1 Tax=Lignipirellula cremea TaxID=2528010 RepID=A0A518DSQ4_9BACT|nr:hypothetical protein Pla8534_26780 [Lignipirellula cremea]
MRQLILLRFPSLRLTNFLIDALPAQGVGLYGLGSGIKRSCGGQLAPLGEIGYNFRFGA